MAHSYMKYIFLIVSTLTCVNSTLSKSFDRRNYFDGKCYDAQTKRELLVGEYFQREGQCIRVQCLGDLSLWEDKCNDPEIHGNCIKEFLHLDQPYPNCCPLYKCEYHFGSTKEMKVFDHYGNLISRSVTNTVLVEDGGMVQTIKVRI